MKGLIVNMENSKFIIENGNLKSVVSNEKNIDIPANVIRIAPGAFKNCKAEKITFASGSELKSIDDEAFYGCSSLEGIKIPIGVVKIGDHAFCDCKNMRYISIPDSVVAIGKDILDDCNDLLLIIGNESSEAGTVANQYGLAIRSAYTTNKKEQKKNTNGLGLSIVFFLIAVCELVIGFIGELGLIQLIGIGTLLLSILFIIVYSTRIQRIHKERKNRPEKKIKE